MKVPPASLYSLFVLIMCTIFDGCSTKTTTNPKEVTDCIQNHLLTPEKELVVRKKIDAERKFGQLDSLFTRKAKVQGFNGSVLVVEKGVVLYEKQFGYLRLSKKDSLTPFSAFQLASISKTFTGTGILLLAQDKKLHLTDSIQQYIPDFPYHNISIANLLSHRSGLPNYMYSFEEKRRQNAVPPSNDSILNWFIHADSLPALYNQPNKSFSYNNTNFIILASIIEKVSKMSYANFMQNRIFAPLGMTHTFIDTIAPDSLLKNRTTGHQGGRAREREFYDGVYGDKGVYSTAHDMFRWYIALQSGCLLNKHWTKEAFTPRSTERRSRHNYGYGFRLMTDPDQMDKVHYVYHGGWWAGYSTMFWMDPEAETAIIVLSNRKNNTVYEIKPVLSILEGNKDSGLENMGDESDE